MGKSKHRKKHKIKVAQHKRKKIEEKNRYSKQMQKYFEALKNNLAAQIPQGTNGIIQSGTSEQLND